MIPVQTLTTLAKAIYNPRKEFDQILDNGSVYAGKIDLPDVTILTFRGSVTGLDWLHDFEALPIVHPLVGTIHEGFWQGVPEMFEQLNLKAGQTVAIIGHSLGCAHAAYTARLCLLRGITVGQLYLLAPPKLGYRDFYDGLRNIQDLKAWHNGLDPVPSVPVTLPDFPWEQFNLIEITVTPGGIDNFLPQDYHNINLYWQGIS